MHTIKNRFIISSASKFCAFVSYVCVCVCVYIFDDFLLIFDHIVCVCITPLIIIQACHLTSGIYLKPPHPTQLLQYLVVSDFTLSTHHMHLHSFTYTFRNILLCTFAAVLYSHSFVFYFAICIYFHKTIFLPDEYCRKHLVLPQQSKVDYRATCFCHKNVIDIGFVCPVCLSSTYYY